MNISELRKQVDLICTYLLGMEKKQASESMDEIKSANPTLYAAIKARLDVVRKSAAGGNRKPN